MNGARCERGSVLILSAEDDVADTIRPRLEAAGAEVDRVHVLDAVRDDDGRRTFDIIRDLDRLGGALNRLDHVALVVIDPISAYLGKTDSHRNSDVRAALAPLSELAAKHEVAVILVSHLNKSTGGDALSRVTGSIAFTAAVRAAYLVTKDEADSARRLFVPVKNNIGDDATGFAFHIESTTISGINTSAVKWEPEFIITTADEALAAGGADSSAMNEAREFLQSLLTDQRVASRTVESEAKSAGLSWATVKRASESLNIKKKKDGLRGEWTWGFQNVTGRGGDGHHHPDADQHPDQHDDAQLAQLAHRHDLSKLSKLENAEHLHGVEISENAWEVEL